MKTNRLKDYIKLSSFYNLLQPYREMFLLGKWLRDSTKRTVPQVIKRSILFSVARENGCKVLVETGTYLGDTVGYALDCFEEVHSIEISEQLHERAQKIFADRPNLHLYLGDSGDVLPTILPSLKRPAVFWLDGHFSEHVTGRGVEDTPVLRELQALLRSDIDHVAVIDDAREFGTNPAYPPLETVRDLVASTRPAYQMIVLADLIVITPRRMG